MRRALSAFGAQVIHAVKRGDIDDKQQIDRKRVEHRAAAQQVIKNIVGRAVAAHQKHIVVGQKHVGDIRRDAEAGEDGEGDRHILFLQARRARDHHVERRKTGDAVRQSRGDVVKRDHRIRAVVVAGAVGAEHRTQQPEDRHEIERRLLHSAFCERRKRDGDQLDAAKKERQDIKPGQRVVVAEADDDDLNEFDPVHPDRRDRQGLELFPETAAAVPDAQKHRQRDHHDHQRGNENQMLGGEIPLGRAAVPAESEKFLQKSVPPFSRILCFV